MIRFPKEVEGLIIYQEIVENASFTKTQIIFQSKGLMKVQYEATNT